LLKKVKKIKELGIPIIALFPVIKKHLKSKNAEEAYNMNALLQKTIGYIKQHVPGLGIMTDVALDAYTIDGHDGITNKNGYVSNDKTINILVKQALSHALMGSDFLAPSDMMDGRILAIREALEDNKLYNTKIISYAAKYSSSFYNHFRDALGSNISLKNKNKNQYQIDISNEKESMKEIEMEIMEGADMCIIKPGMLYLDIIKNASKNFNIPIIAYQVSGEYAMLKYAIMNDILPKSIIMESMIAFKRAGANAIISYFAEDIAQVLRK